MHRLISLNLQRRCSISLFNFPYCTVNASVYTIGFTRGLLTKVERVSYSDNRFADIYGWCVPDCTNKPSAQKVRNFISLYYLLSVVMLGHLHDIFYIFRPHMATDKHSLTTAIVLFNKK